MTNQADRLRRELRALATVNRQLQAQLEEPVGARRDRRSSIGIGWIEQLATLGSSEASLVRAENGSIFVIEESRKRPVRSGLVAAAIEDVLGATRDANQKELAEYAEGVPVELFESSNGAPFVVVGGKRHSMRGVPLPYPVDNRHASEFPEGNEMNVAAANVSRRRFEQAASGQLQLTRMRGSLEANGALGTAKTLVRRVGGRAKRALFG